jgi:hypothetical protein
VSWINLPDGLNGLTGAPHHMVFTYDGSLLITGLNFWLDGILRTRSGTTSETLLAGDTFSNTTALSVQRNAQIESHYISDLAIYPRALPVTEILEHYNWAPDFAARYQAEDAGYVRSSSRPAKNLRSLTSSTSTQRRKRRKVNPGIN